MSNTTRLFINQMPVLIRYYFNNLIMEKTYVELTIAEALNHARKAGLNNTQTDEWIEHWLEFYTEDVSESSYYDGQVSMYPD